MKKITEIHHEIDNPYRVLYHITGTGVVTAYITGVKDENTHLTDCTVTIYKGTEGHPINSVELDIVPRGQELNCVVLALLA